MVKILTNRNANILYVKETLDDVLAFVNSKERAKVLREILEGTRSRRVIVLRKSIVFVAED